MKKTMLLGLFVLGLSLISFAMDSKEEILPKEKAKLINHMCENGEVVQYYTHSSFSQADYDEIVDELCSE